MLIDCDSCAVRGAACKGCLVTALFEAPVDGLGPDEARAIEVFARGGFEVEVISRQPAALRMVRPRSRSGFRVA